MLVHADLVWDHANPDAVLEHPYPYFGMRARMRAPKNPSALKLSPRFTSRQVLEATGRSAQAWGNWTRGHSPMPKYMSAYMALLDDVHPTYRLRKLSVKDGSGVTTAYTSLHPPIPTATYAEVRELMDDRGLTDEDVLKAFMVESTTQFGPVSLGNDGVRWLILRLMCDDMPLLKVSARRGDEPIVPEPLSEEAKRRMEYEEMRGFIESPEQRAARHARVATRRARRDEERMARDPSETPEQYADRMQRMQRRKAASAARCAPDEETDVQREERLARMARREAMRGKPRDHTARSAEP